MHKIKRFAQFNEIIFRGNSISASHIAETLFLPSTYKKKEA